MQNPDVIYGRRCCSGSMHGPPQCRGSTGHWPAGSRSSLWRFRRRSRYFFTTCEPADAQPAESEVSMNTHPYLRAFLAGTFVPTLILPLFLTVFIVVRLILQTPIPIERGLVFPMALVPILWALWNVLWLGSHSRTHLPIGPHGALLPLLLMPAGAIAASCLGILGLGAHGVTRSEEHTSELQSLRHLVCRLLLE